MRAAAPLRASALILALVGACATVTKALERTAEPMPNSSSPPDPFLWLEEIRGERALAWAEHQNARTEAELRGDPRFAEIRAGTLSILNAEDRIPYGRIRGQYLYNFWQDEKNLKGVWRRQLLERYLKNDVEWQTLVDIDALAASEGEDWVYQSVSCAPPKFERCLLSLSRGGKDASVKREFDLVRRRFVEGGFRLAEAKSEAHWIDENTLLIATDFGAASMTTSGYPRTVRLWRRGSPLSEAPILLEGEKTDVACWPWVFQGPQGPMVLAVRSPTFFGSKVHRLNIASPADRPAALPLPDDIDPQGVLDGRWMLFSLRTAWQHAGHNFTAGSLLAADLRPTVTTHRATHGHAPLQVELVFAPTQHTAIKSVHLAKKHVYLSLLEHVKARLSRVERTDAGGWQVSAVPLPSATGVASLVSVDNTRDDFFFSHEDPLTPESLYYVASAQSAPRYLRSIAPRFSSDGARVEQRFATSADGTKIPYFVATPRGFADGTPRPTYLYGYGGFEISVTPSYRPVTGKFWLERGGVYVQANIRGGGEYGPAWHRAALKGDRQRSYDDFHAVAEDLIAAGITTPAQLGIHGGSNGGLLVGVAFSQRPDLYGAVVCEVPLLDMMRYHRLLAGASWVAEYGDPDNPDDRAAIRAYSPYHNIKPDQPYPRVFFTTSTADDRVHPGHARKMAARMIDMGYSIYYFENIVGGHGGASDNQQRALTISLKFTYLMRELGLDDRFLPSAVPAAVPDN